MTAMVLVVTSMSYFAHDVVDDVGYVVVGQGMVELNPRITTLVPAGPEWYLVLPSEAGDVRLGSPIVAWEIERETETMEDGRTFVTRTSTPVTANNVEADRLQLWGIRDPSGQYYIHDVGPLTREGAVGYFAEEQAAAQPAGRQSAT
jgi:hypothetical protein